MFEEVTVQSVDETVGGPFGPIEGALLVEELHMDGATEEKYFAPGYGEFFTSGGGDTEALALAVPTVAVDEPVPDALTTVEAAPSKSSQPPKPKIGRPRRGRSRSWRPGGWAGDRRDPAAGRTAHDR